MKNARSNIARYKISVKLLFTIKKIERSCYNNKYLQKYFYQLVTYTN